MEEAWKPGSGHWAKGKHMEENSGRVFDSGYEEAGAGRQESACSRLLEILYRNGDQVTRTQLKFIYQD